MGQIIAVGLLSMLLWQLFRRQMKRPLTHEVSEEDLVELLSSPEWYR